MLEHFTGKQVPEEETGFLTVHFGAAMVRQEGRKEEIRQVDIGIVCSSGIGISRLMLSKLNKLFGDRVNLTAYGKNDITSYVQGKTDFFVSSLPIEKAEIPVIHVNPLLNEEDIDQILGVINSTRSVYDYDQEILDIITDEVAAYFAGDKDVQTTASMIQSRVNLYVQEQR